MGGVPTSSTGSWLPAPLTGGFGSHAKVGSALLPEGAVSEYSEEGVLLAVQAELISVKEKINRLILKVDSGLG